MARNVLKTYICWWLLLACSLFLNPAIPQNPSIPSPAEFAGYSPGERPWRYEQVVSYFRLLAERSNRAVLVENGQTFEGRTLIYLLISSPENLQNREAIRTALAQLTTPDRLTSARAQKIIEQTPAVAWMMYSIHGDEISGTDASVLLAYDLVTGEDSLTSLLRDRLLIGIDPMENPDGRERYLAQLQSWWGRVSNGDVQSIQHTGRWPWGRGNHYLFDLNRDWFPLVNPESQARVEALRAWNPQLVVDAHEMGSLDTYLFPPARDPFNPHIPEPLKKWVERFSQDQARAFDQHGWSYYTREWLEDWYPGYGSNYPFYRGAIPILYEQAGTEGTWVRRPDGSKLTYREAVQHQYVSSLANLQTLASHREEILRTFYQHYQQALSLPRGKAQEAYFLLPGENPDRLGKLVERLLTHGIQCYVAEEPFRAREVQDYWKQTARSTELPAGTVVVPLRQPLRYLIQAIMDFDPRMNTRFLKWERKSLVKEGRTRLYEVSAWSLPMAFGVSCYRGFYPAKLSLVPLTEWEDPAGQVNNASARYGFLIDWRNDHAIPALVSLFRQGIQVRFTNQKFSAAHHHFPQGALLIRKHENEPHLVEKISQIALENRVEVFGVHSARSSSGPDLGGNAFQLLEPPRIAVVMGSAFSTTSFSAIWYLLDQKLAIPHSLILQENLPRTDLRPYNVLLLPSAWQPAALKQILNKQLQKQLKSWVQAGGTLIALGNSAAFLADTATGFSRVRLRRQALNKLTVYQTTLQWEETAIPLPADSIELWEGTPQVAIPLAEKDQMASKQELQEWDAFLQKFQPRGAILRAKLDTTHWMSAGIGEQVPVILYTRFAYLARDPVQVVARLAEGRQLRLSGLLWPEARERWQNTAYATRESLGKGQVILFAGEPFFRAYFHGSGRLLINALLLGPGMGTSLPLPGITLPE